MKKIKSFGVVQTAKTAAVIYFLLSAIILIPMALFMLFTGNESTGGLPYGPTIFLLLPFIYALVGFIMVALGCIIYNNVSKYIGGIEVEIE